MKCHLCGKEVPRNHISDGLAECAMISFYSEKEMENPVEACVDRDRQMFFCHEECALSHNIASMMWCCKPSWESGNSECECEICKFFKSEE